MLHRGPVTVVARFEMHDLAQGSLRDQLPDGQKIAIPTAVVKHREKAPGILRQRGELIRFIDRDGERLVHHHVLAGKQGAAGQLEVRIVRGGDRYQVHGGILEHGFGRRDHGRLGQIGLHLRGLARHDGCERQARDTENQRRVQGLPGEPVSQQGDVHSGFHIFTKWHGSLVGTSAGNGAVPSAR